MSYGPYLDDITWRSAAHVDKILRGASPAELPVLTQDPEWSVEALFEPSGVAGRVIGATFSIGLRQAGTGRD